MWLRLAAVARRLRAADPSERKDDHAILFRHEKLETRAVHHELHDGAHTAVTLQRAEVALGAIAGGWQRQVDVLRAGRLGRRVQALLGGSRCCLRLDEHLVVQGSFVGLAGPRHGREPVADEQLGGVLLIAKQDCGERALHRRRSLRGEVALVLWHHLHLLSDKRFAQKLFGLRRVHCIASVLLGLRWVGVVGFLAGRSRAADARERHPSLGTILLGNDHGIA
mmetsp:Transcript_15270/g.30893  ORF Transcript_15270/g.30893 Transcript_15270/m.30893 type:complete len:223 (-) Transcript_15270:1039-1707(-)